VLQSLADACPALTRSLSFYATFPWPREGIPNWMRGDGIGVYDLQRWCERHDYERHFND
jgi:hypothetical protein